MRGKLAVDAVALVAYVIVSLPSLTGVAFHEWLGLAVFVVLAVHLAQHLYQVILKRAPASDGAARRATPARVARAVLAVLLAVALAWGLKKLCDGIRGKAKKGRSSYDGK